MIIIYVNLRTYTQKSSFTAFLHDYSAIITFMSFFPILKIALVFTGYFSFKLIRIEQI